MSSENHYQQQLAAAQAEITKYQQEIADLQQTLEERTVDIYKLIQWMQSLQQDITAVYNSITWQAGHLFTQIALKLLRRSPGPTAQDHIQSLFTAFEAWKINHFQKKRTSSLQSYRPWHDMREYHLWIKQYDTDHLSRQTKMVQWSYRPLISILMPLDTSLIESTWVSIETQIYPDWELIIILREAGLTPAFKNNKIKYIKSYHTPLATALNQGLNLAQGDFITFLSTGDQLSPQALYQIAEILNTYPDRDLIYSDEDRLDAEGRRYDPYFKTDWNPDLFYSQNFLRHFTAYRRTLVNQVGGLKPDYPGCEDYDLALRMLEKIPPSRIHHIPQILYHQIANDQNNSEAQVQALQAHFQRLNQPVQVKTTVGGHTRVRYPLPEKLPLVSLIIPTRDKLSLLRGTLTGLLHHTDYHPLEIIILDNGSREPATLAYLKELTKDNRIKVIRHTAPFNYSQLNNIGVSHAAGQILGLLNNDLEVITPTWLTEMVSHVLRPEVGAVGAKLYYANDTLQHAGVIIGLGGLAGHGFKYLAKEAPGYHWKPFLTQNYSAVTGACLLIRRQVFEEVGGLEEEHLKVSFNDVDLCLRLRQRGYRIVWTPYAELYHLESASRGLDNTVKKYLRLRREVNFMKSRWGTILFNDPYYNPNLTIDYEDFSLAWPPRTSTEQTNER